MISFNINQALFTYRVAAVCIDDNHILLQKSADDSFWFLPGGRAEIMETSETAIRREMREELQLDEDVRIERLLWVIENLFTDQDAANHEIGFYYQISLPNRPELHDKSKPVAAVEDTGLHADQPVAFAFHWVPLDTLDHIALYPMFLKTALRNLPGSVQHVVETDSDE